MSVGVDVKKIVMPVAVVASVVGVAVMMTLFIAQMRGDVDAIAAAARGFSAIQSDWENRLRDVELQASRNEARSTVNQIAIEERLQRIEASVLRLEDFVRANIDGLRRSP